MNQFRVRIDLGNDAMNTREDVASALQKIIDRLNSGIEEGLVIDENGNRVGSWDYSNEADEYETEEEEKA